MNKKEYKKKAERKREEGERERERERERDLKPQQIFLMVHFDTHSQCHSHKISVLK